MEAMKTIAICFSLPRLENELEDLTIGKRYPGAGWIPHLVSLAKSKGYEVLAGTQAVRYVYNGMLDPRNVLVVQEELSPEGISLLNMGADPTLLMCLESPIFTPHFYDHLNKMKSHFKHSMLFDQGTEHLYFPSFDEEDRSEIRPWDGRAFMCMVSANKHYSMLGANLSPSFKWAVEHQLHDARFKAIEYFHGKEGFRLYGKGWGDIAPACQDKLDTMRHYQFSLCFENGSYPGYVTEKVIDCIVAGVIPVYMGPPERHQWIPSNIVIDANLFDDLPSMEKYLRGVTEDFAQHLITEGQWWLSSEEGQKYNNKVFARRVMELLGGSV